MCFSSRLKFRYGPGSSAGALGGEEGREEEAVGRGGEVVEVEPVRREHAPGHAPAADLRGETGGRRPCGASDTELNGFLGKLREIASFSRIASVF